MWRRSRLLLLLIAVGLLLSWPLGSHLGSREDLQRERRFLAMDHTAEALLKATLKGELSEARQHMERLANEYERQAIPLMIPYDGLHAVSQSIQEARKAFAAASPDAEQLIMHATRVRLAIDALHHMHQPMWREYHSSVARHLQRMMDAAAKQDAALLKAEFVRNFQLYATIRPAMSVHMEVGRLRDLNESYGVLRDELSQSRIDWPAVRAALRSLNEDMRAAFLAPDQTVLGRLFDPDSPLMMMVSMVLLLSVALAYVGWKKYVGEERRM